MKTEDTQTVMNGIPRNAARDSFGIHGGEWKPIEAPFVSTADALPKDGQRVEYKPDLNEQSAPATYIANNKNALCRFQMDHRYVRDSGFSTGHFGIVPGYWRPLESSPEVSKETPATPTPEPNQNDSTGDLEAFKAETEEIVGIIGGEVGELSRQLEALMEAMKHINEGCIQHVDLTGDISKKLDATMNALHEMGNLEGSSPIVNMIKELDENQEDIGNRLKDL